jgi:hypothetical protein
MAATNLGAIGATTIHWFRLVKKDSRSSSNSDWNVWGINAKIYFGNPILKPCTGNFFLTEQKDGRKYPTCKQQR